VSLLIFSSNRALSCLILPTAGWSHSNSSAPTSKSPFGVNKTDYQALLVFTTPVIWIKHSNFFFTKQELTDVYLVCICLQVTTLSDIVLADGKVVLTLSWNGHHIPDRRSTMQFARQL
jgi:hypothetical protein